MGRPPSADRKEVVTLRIRQSVLDAYKAQGEDWRSKMEAAIDGALAPPTDAVPAKGPAPQKAAPAKPPERPRVKSRLKGEWKAP